VFPISPIFAAAPVVASSPVVATSPFRGRRNRRTTALALVAGSTSGSPIEPTVKAA
jgi:hypothetical protein